MTILVLIGLRFKYITRERLGLYSGKMIGIIGLYPCKDTSQKILTPAGVPGASADLRMTPGRRVKNLNIGIIILLWSCLP
jgi:hypothetical protein